MGLPSLVVGCNVAGWLYGFMAMHLIGYMVGWLICCVIGYVVGFVAG